MTLSVRLHDSLFTSRDELSWREVLVFCVVFAAVLLVSHIARDDGHVAPEMDALRYIDYAVTLDQFGIFGLSKGDLSQAPKPGNANTPLYPAFVAGLMTIDPGLRETLVCLASREIPNRDCVLDLSTFLVAQNALTLLSLLMVFVLTVRLTRLRSAGWLAAALTLGSGVFFEFQALFLTENLILPLFLALMLCVALLYEDARIRWVVCIGGLLALLTLVRPAYLYLFYGFVVFFLGLLAIKRKQQVLLHLVALIVSFSVITGPWLMRNKVQLGEWSLTDGYAEVILAQRLAFNRMSWPEVGTAFLYWLPDFGDSLAKQLVKPEYYEKLGWGPQSYYITGNSKDFLTQEAQKAGGEEKLIAYWIGAELIGNAPKHLAVSAALAWRGSFVAKYWGLIGLIAFTALLLANVRRKAYMLLIVALPVWYMVAFHGALSVSIPRYNLPLIALCAPAMAFYICRFASAAIKSMPPGQSDTLSPSN